jgi:hypothetical protein
MQKGEYMTRKLFTLILVLLLGLPACSSLDEATPLPIPPTNTAVPKFDLAMLKNGEYSITYFDGSIRTFRLADGLYQSGNDPAQEDFATARMGDLVAFGDLNGDGLDDAAFTLAMNFGGTGMFAAVIAVVDQNGQPVQPAPPPMEDLPVINMFYIQDGEIFVDAVIHGINDPNCCPSQPVTETYRLFSTGLAMTHYTSRTLSGTEHAITIESPVEGAELLNPVVITGSVTISPFENTLDYKVFTGDGQFVNQGPLMVNTAEMGGPGTFELIFDLTMAGVTGPIRVEIWDLSPADGSPLAMDAIELVLK